LSIYIITYTYRQLILNPLYVDKIVIPKDMSVDLIDAYVLIEWLKMGRLKGEFKK